MAAWTATEGFEYSVGGLNGNNGGTGWSAAWATDAGITVVSSPVFAGSGACKISSSSGDGSRSLTTGVTSGIMRVYVYAATVPTGTKGFYPALLRDAGTIKFRLSWGTSDSGASGNNLVFCNGAGSTSVNLASPTGATWNYVDIQFDQAGSQARASYNGGAWSSYISQAFTQIDSYRITNADGNAGDQGYEIDAIGVGTGPVTATSSPDIRSYFY
jgi:hypothetical protein